MFEKVSRSLKYDSNYFFVHKHIYIYYIPPPLSVHFPMMRSVRYKLIFNGLKFMLHHTRVLNNIVITTVKEKVWVMSGKVWVMSGKVWVMSGKVWVMSGKVWVTRLCNPHFLTNQIN